MRLAIVNLTGGGFSGGYKKYLKNILPRLAEHNNVEALLCVSPEGNDISTWFKKPPVADYCSFSPCSLSHLAHIPDRKMLTCLRKFSPDIVFLPVARYIRLDGTPVVNMVRNMEPFVANMKGDTLLEMFKKFVQRQIARNSVRRADYTIAVSSFVKEYLTSTLKVLKNKVSLIYHGLTQQPNESFMYPVSVPIGWDGGFLFTCGSIRPARGLEDLVEALSDLKTRNLNMRMVIAGETVPGMRKYRDGLRRLIALRGLTENVCWAGSLNDAEMHWCYERCSLFIMTSRVEACPNIALEAMSHGCVCISTESLPMKEFFGEAAIYYPPKNGHALAEATKRILALDKNLRKIMSEKSRRQATKFSWDVCAERTVALLAEVVKISKFNGHNVHK